MAEEGFQVSVEVYLTINRVCELVKTGTIVNILTFKLNKYMVAVLKIFFRKGDSVVLEVDLRSLEHFPVYLKLKNSQSYEIDEQILEIFVL